MDDLKVLGAIHKRVDKMREPAKDLLRAALAAKGVTPDDVGDVRYVLEKHNELSAEGKALAAKKINGSGATAPEGTA